MIVGRLAVAAQPTLIIKLAVSSTFKTETFDMATTLREVKLLYATLSEHMIVQQPTAKKMPSSTRSVVTEGLASKSVGASTAPSADKEDGVLNEELQTARRLQQLAGIL